MSSEEEKIVGRLKLRSARAQELADSSQSVLDWIKENDIQHLAVHLDLDVLDPKMFRSLLFSEPGGRPIDAPSGEMTLTQIGRLIQDVSKQTDLVGLSIAEHLPWDALNLHDFLATIPLFD